MNKGHLIIFARAPRLGRVKTRLARDIGALAALQTYRQIASASLRRLNHSHLWHGWLAVDSRSALSGLRLLPAGWRRIAQGGGDLGERMARVMRCVPSGPVVIAGSDVPSLNADDIVAAFRVLHDKDIVFGPAMDGGFWLIGFKRRPIPYKLFDEVRWASRNALADTLANTEGHSVGYIDLLEDIDTGAALSRWRSGVLKPRRAAARPTH